MEHLCTDSVISIGMIHHTYESRQPEQTLSYDRKCKFSNLSDSAKEDLVKMSFENGNCPQHLIVLSDPAFRVLLHQHNSFIQPQTFEEYRPSKNRS